MEEGCPSSLDIDPQQRSVVFVDRGDTIGEKGELPATAGEQQRRAGALPYTRAERCIATATQGLRASRIALTRCITGHAHLLRRGPGVPP